MYFYNNFHAMYYIPSLTYFILDPITSIAPKFSSTTNIQGFKIQRCSSFDMLCPSQGYPVPISRWVGHYNNLNYIFLLKNC